MPAIPETSVHDLASRLQKGDAPLLLDVRRHDENALVKLPGSVLIPLHELSERLDELDPERETVVYCHHGVRSLSGAAILLNAGFKQVTSLRGGIDAWSVDIDPSAPRY